MNINKLVAVLVIALITTVCSSQAFSAQSGAAAKPVEQLSDQLIAKININTADEAVLTELPGVGPKTAERIHLYRQQNGPFKTLDDLLNVKGIGPKVLDKIRPYATLS
ncbi:MAG: helix-hairpin-helix domain-containing protein [Desulfobulbaceae bacterium]|nr:MAG: helix-hairpin-helix domain-containing protein [Desulfobulbaceae bacterium]